MDYCLGISIFCTSEFVKIPEISFYIVRGNVPCGYILFGEYLGEFIQEFILLGFQQSHLRIYLK